MYGRFSTLLLGVLLGGLSCQGTPPVAPTPGSEALPEIATPPETSLRAEPPAIAPARKVAQRPRDGLGSSYSKANDHSHTLLSF
ncbi:MULTISPECIES: hypothetical protein [Pseudomonas]|uniref:hypothetical protein n=1 Tax=Pseudomonas TaxID=286 RepID=UPI000B35CD07|nr:MULTISPECIES: hypothetical protein [Pseudomonas]PMY63510.1 hypothetical protein C1Y31_19665 [Pseudomonas sp. FW305-25]PMY66825.1 hypothetical protein C1Y32_20695 [Pseudomonas sp. FW126-L8]PNA77959.1 hypothetical protein C1Y33_16715 [Pseudomonas sp. FW305-76]